MNSHFNYEISNNIVRPSSWRLEINLRVNFMEKIDLTDIWMTFFWFPSRRGEQLINPACSVLDSSSLLPAPSPLGTDKKSNFFSFWILHWMYVKGCSTKRQWKAQVSFFKNYKPRSLIKNMTISHSASDQIYDATRIHFQGSTQGLPESIWDWITWNQF